MRGSCKEETIRNQQNYMDYKETSGNDMKGIKCPPNTYNITILTTLVALCCELAYPLERKAVFDAAARNANPFRYQ